MEAYREGSKNATIPKSKLGSLINERMNAMTPNTRRILMTGFRKCGIVPCNPLEPVSQFPTAVVNNDLVGDSFKGGLDLNRGRIILLDDIHQNTPDTGKQAQNRVTLCHTSIETGIQIKSAR